MRRHLARVNVVLLLAPLDTPYWPISRPGWHRRTRWPLGRFVVGGTGSADENDLDIRRQILPGTVSGEDLRTPDARECEARSISERQAGSHGRATMASDLDRGLCGERIDLEWEPEHDARDLVRVSAGIDQLGQDFCEVDGSDDRTRRQCGFDPVRPSLIEQVRKQR